MNKEFFEKIFPSQGNVCIAGIKEKVIAPRFVDSVDKALALAQSYIDKESNVYFTPGTYEGMRRRQEDCVWVKSFFLDLDVEHGDKKYPSKEEALADVQRFRHEIGWPEPVLVDSGGGIHAYWIFDEEIPADEWNGYAKKFKQLCLDLKMIIDEGVPADSARLMRIPGTFNYRYDPPRPSVMLSEVFTYDISTLLPALGNVESPFDLKQIDKGLDPDTQAIFDKRRGNFEYDFSKIVQASLEGNGCEQIKWIIENAADCSEPLWYAGLSVAVRCRDGAEAIHKMSEDYPGYSAEETERKAAQSLREATWAHGCDAFRKENAERCANCAYAGAIPGPIEIGKIVRIVETAEQEQDATQPVRDTKDPEKILVFPDFLKPYQRGANGGIYYVPPPRRDKKGKVIQDDPELLTANDVYPTKRVYSPQDGECLVMKLFLPLDSTREFLLPLRDVAATEKLKAALAGNGVVFEPSHAPRLASYLMRWSAYLIETQKADIMRHQQGWTEELGSFVVGTTEITPTGDRNCPPSPMAKNVVKNVHTKGDFHTWRNSIQMLNDPGYELHAFAMLCGFASPLMQLTNVNGVTLSLYSSDPGTGKTGALNGALSVWGNPVSLAVIDATANALINRMITCKNIPFGLDEQGNMEPKVVSNLIYNISSGMPKLRMMSSANQERDLSFVTNLIAILTTNRALRGLLHDYRADSAAENIRLLEPTIVRPNVRGYELTMERGQRMFEPLKTNYGHAGPEYIRGLYQHGLDNVQRMVQVEYLKVADRYSKSAEYRFLSNLLATVRAAGELCSKLNLLQFDLDRIFGIVGQDFDDLIAGKKREDETSHLDVVGDFINDNIQNCLVVRDGKVTTEPRQALYVRAEVDTGLIFISTSALKDYLKAIRMDIRSFEAKLSASGVLQGKIKKQMAAGWKDAFGSTNVNAYELKFDVSHLFHEQQDKIAA
jgi:hypothetical protein